jgi:hypothetical protein
MIEVNLKELVEFFGGKCLFGGALIQFNEDSFKEMYRQIYDAGMLTEREEIAKMVEPWLQPEYVEQIRARGQE